MPMDVIGSLRHIYATITFVFGSVDRLMVNQSSTSGVIGRAKGADERTVVGGLFHGVLRCFPWLSLGSFYTSIIVAERDEISLR